MNNLTGKLDKRVFDSVEEIKETYNIDVIIPDNIPNSCNIVAYEISDITNVDFYKEDKDDFSYWSLICKDWCSSGNYTLEGEVFDDIRNGYEIIYLRLITKDKFTPERLLGVKTTLGYITTIINEGVVMLSSNNVYWYNLNLLKYYISDDSDETVSFDEYVKLFYDVVGVL